MFIRFKDKINKAKMKWNSKNVCNIDPDSKVVIETIGNQHQATFVLNNKRLMVYKVIVELMDSRTKCKELAMERLLSGDLTGNFSE